MSRRNERPRRGGQSATGANFEDAGGAGQEHSTPRGRAVARAVRRKLRKNARATALKYASRGFYETTGDGHGLVRIEHPAAVEAITRAAERFMRNNCEPLCELLSPEAAEAFPSAATRPAWAARCYLTLDFDFEGRLAFRTDWCGGPDAGAIEREAVALIGAARLEPWRRTSGFGDLPARGRA